MEIDAEAGGVNVEIHDTIFLTNSADGPVSISTLRENYLKFSLQFPATCMFFQRTAAPTILLGMGSTKQEWVSLLFRFICTIFSSIRALSAKRTVLKSALIPGGPYGTTHL
jgi:hypothetical protein